MQGPLCVFFLLLEKGVPLQGKLLLTLDGKSGEEGERDHTFSLDRRAVAWTLHAKEEREAGSRSVGHALTLTAAHSVSPSNFLSPNDAHTHNEYQDMERHGMQRQLMI